MNVLSASACTVCYKKNLIFFLVFREWIRRKRSSIAKYHVEEKMSIHVSPRDELYTKGEIDNSLEINQHTTPGITRDNINQMVIKYIKNI